MGNHYVGRVGIDRFDMLLSMGLFAGADADTVSRKLVTLCPYCMYTMYDDAQF